MKTLSNRRYLPDVNILLALSDRDHTGYIPATTWFSECGHEAFLLCNITEAGFVRLMCSPHLYAVSMKVATELLRQIACSPNCSYLPMNRPWLELVAPFSSRLHGYKQVTDALLLGLAIHNGATLVTLDRHIQAMAGEEFKDSVLTLA
ncbi:TA system VapC family ribonuclease toxin [Telmatobacter bradus]|uniref:TA system VapC family ribonuclease toxin n=1 Tax=Telmatobacter bradus TaxID=474953 RepID=UPI003B42BF81